ncbi:MAG: hypothetical protein M1281_00485 [Chloroflexi bacterium]|nr:hypothetical protein [Chloroflexota bacterium]
MKSQPRDSLAFDKIAELLALLGYTPDEYGVPQGEWPNWPKTNPLALLDAEGERVGPGDEHRETLAWKADILWAATLVWAGVINLCEDEIKQEAPLTDWMEVALFLRQADLDKFWNRPGVGISSPAEFREKYQDGKIHRIQKDELHQLLFNSK